MLEESACGKVPDAKECYWYLCNIHSGKYQYDKGPEFGVLGGLGIQVIQISRCAISNENKIVLVIIQLTSDY